MIYIGPVVMILRVWALYNRSILVLGTLLALYGMAMITFFICYVIFFAGSGSPESKLK